MTQALINEFSETRLESVKIVEAFKKDVLGRKQEATSISVFPQTRFRMTFSQVYLFLYIDLLVCDLSNFPPNFFFLRPCDLKLYFRKQLTVMHYQSVKSVSPLCFFSLNPWNVPIWRCVQRRWIDISIAQLKHWQQTKLHMVTTVSPSQSKQRFKNGNIN